MEPIHKHLHHSTVGGGETLSSPLCERRPQNQQQHHPNATRPRLANTTTALRRQHALHDVLITHGFVDIPASHFFQLQHVQEGKLTDISQNTLGKTIYLHSFFPLTSDFGFSYQSISRLIMKYFLWSFSPFHWFKKGSCQFLAKECAQYWLTT